VCVCWSTTQISIHLTNITGNKTVIVLVTGLQCFKRLTEHSTSVQITSKLFSSPVLHFIPRQLFTRILYTVLWVQTLWPLDMGVGQKSQMFWTIILYLKRPNVFPIFFISISVPDDVFKLQAEICRIFYTLEVLSIDLFIYNKQTAGRLTSRFCQTHRAISFPNINRLSYYSSTLRRRP